MARQDGSGDQRHNLCVVRSSQEKWQPRSSGKEMPLVFLRSSLGQVALAVLVFQLDRAGFRSTLYRELAPW